MSISSKNIFFPLHNGSAMNHYQSDYVNISSVYFLRYSLIKLVF